MTSKKLYQELTDAMPYYAPRWLSSGAIIANVELANDLPNADKLQLMHSDLRAHVAAHDEQHAPSATIVRKALIDALKFLRPTSSFTEACARQKALKHGGSEELHYAGEYVLLTLYHNELHISVTDSDKSKPYRVPSLKTLNWRAVSVSANAPAGTVAQIVVHGYAIRQLAECWDDEVLKLSVGRYAMQLRAEESRARATFNLPASFIAWHRFPLSSVYEGR